jgi:hypothetical protein
MSKKKEKTEKEIWKANESQEPLRDERKWPDDFKRFGTNVRPKKAK